MNTDKIYAEQLANEYAPKDTSKVVALRKLDNKAKLPATIFTYTFGIITALVAGEGMCLSMKVIGSGATAMFVLGVIAGIIGLLGMGINYPICKKLLHPPVWVLIFVPLLSFAALTAVFVRQCPENILVYLIYSLSAYSLTIWLAALPGLTRRAKSAMMGSKLLQKLLHLLLRDTTSKTLLFADASASIRGLRSTFSMWCSASWLPSTMPRYGFSPWRSIIWYWGVCGHI